MTRHDPTLSDGSETPQVTALAPPISKLERRVVTGFVERLFARQGQATPFFALLRQSDADLAALIAAEAASAARPGPYGRFPPGPIRAEDLDGPPYRTPPALCARLGERLAAALEFAHLLALHPGDLGPETLEALGVAGWTGPGIAELAEQIGAVAQQTRSLAQIHALRPGPRPHTH